MSDNVTWFGDVADGYDKRVQETQDGLDQWVEKGGYGVGRMAVASTTIAFVRFGQSFVDIFRIGNGIKQGTWRGAGEDALRLLTFGGVVGSAAGRLSRVLTVRQVGGTMTCSWVTTANGLRRTGQRFFVSLEELAATAGVDLRLITATGSGVDELKALFAALRKMGVPARRVVPVAFDVKEIGRLAQANRGGVLVFGINFEKGGQTLGHHLYATFSRTAGTVIVDTSGKTYKTLAALSEAYPGARLATLPEALFVIENSALVAAANNSGTLGAMSIVLEVLPVGPRNAFGWDGDPYVKGWSGMR